MNLHEHQSKALFRQHGIPTPKGVTVRTPESAREACIGLGGSRWILKAQAVLVNILGGIVRCGLIAQPSREDKGPRKNRWTARH